MAGVVMIHLAHDLCSPPPIYHKESPTMTDNAPLLFGILIHNSPEPLLHDAEAPRLDVWCNPICHNAWGPLA